MNNIYKLKPILKDAVWGEDTLSSEIGIPTRRISEIWEYINTDEANEVVGGGTTADIISPESYPLVNKILNAAADLSVQVHPRKSEAWYILSAEPGAKLALGFADTNYDIDSMPTDDTILDDLKYYEPQVGQIYYVPKGSVHYVGAGVRALEVQNNILETYRIYDHGRLDNGKPRETHIPEAKTYLNPAKIGKVVPATLPKDGIEETLLSVELFDIKRIIASTDYKVNRDSRPASIIVTKGSATINGIEVKKYDSLFALADRATLDIASPKDLELIVLYSNK